MIPTNVQNDINAVAAAYAAAQAADAQRATTQAALTAAQAADATQAAAQLAAHQAVTAASATFLTDYNAWVATEAGALVTKKS